MFLHERDDHGPRVGQEVAGVHLPASVLGLGEVDLQFVQQRLRVHLGQVGDQDPARTHLRVDLQESTSEQEVDGRRRSGAAIELAGSDFYLHQTGQHQVDGPGLHGDPALPAQVHLMSLPVQNIPRH